MLPLAHPSPQPKRHLDRFSRFAGLTTVTDRRTDRQTDRPTDHATRSVTICRIYVRSTAMRFKNDNFRGESAAFGVLTNVDRYL